MSFTQHTIRVAKKHLRDSDPVMGSLMDRVGPFRLTLERRRFASLARAIVAQQISGAAARTIWCRLVERLKPSPVNAQSIRRLKFDQLRAVGLSQQKIKYLTDLAEKSLLGEIRYARFSRLSDEEIISDLTAVHGIGRWTAQMFLIFSLGRMDVFAPDDLGLRTAIRIAYNLAQLPDKNSSLRLAEAWRPYSTVASWYLWRSLDQAKRSNAASQ